MLLNLVPSNQRSFQRGVEKQPKQKQTLDFLTVFPSTRKLLLLSFSPSQVASSAFLNLPFFFQLPLTFKVSRSSRQLTSSHSFFQKQLQTWFAQSSPPLLSSPSPASLLPNPVTVVSPVPVSPSRLTRSLFALENISSSSRGSLTLALSCRFSPLSVVNGDGTFSPGELSSLRTRLENSH